jgi:hypothetical protein
MENETGGQESDSETPKSPSITNSILVYWVLPVLFIAALSRFAVDTGPAIPIQDPPRPVSFKPNEGEPTSNPPNDPPSFYDDSDRPTGAPSPTTMPSSLRNKPSSYQEASAGVPFANFNLTFCFEHLASNTFDVLFR